MPWIVVGGLVVLVIWLASKTDSVKMDDSTPLNTTANQPGLPLSGAATISPATAHGSYTASRQYQEAIMPFSPLVRNATMGRPLGINPIPLKGMAPSGDVNGTVTSNRQQTMKVSPVTQQNRVVSASVVPPSFSRPLPVGPGRKY